MGRQKRVVFWVVVRILGLQKISNETITARDCSIWCPMDTNNTKPYPPTHTNTLTCVHLLWAGVCGGLQMNFHWFLFGCCGLPSQTDPGSLQQENFPGSHLWNGYNLHPEVEHQNNTHYTFFCALLHRRFHIMDYISALVFWSSLKAQKWCQVLIKQTEIRH